MLNLQAQQWYAIRTRSHFEKVVRDQLIGRGIECLLPVRRSFLTIALVDSV